MLRAFARTQAFAAVGTHALDLRGLSAWSTSRSHGAILLSHRDVGHEHQAHGSGEDGTSHSWLRLHRSPSLRNGFAAGQPLQLDAAKRSAYLVKRILWEERKVTDATILK
jgi:hypothetical protein